MLSRVAVTLFASAALVAGHGLVTDVEIGGKRYIGTKNWDSPENKKSPVRGLPLDTGFVKYRDVTTSMDIACSSAGYKGTPVVAPVSAGSQIKIRWGGDQGPDKKQWPHCEGPEMTYLAPCTNGDCTTFNPSNALWTKIQEAGLDPNGTPVTCFDGHEPWGKGRWVQNKAFSEDSWYTVTIPQDIKPGQYLLRHELVALQIAHQASDGAQYYPVCIQLNISGTGNAQPKGIPATQLYTVDDGLVNIYEGKSHGINSYKVPGPKLYVAGKVENSTPATTSAPTTSKAAPTSTKTVPTSGHVVSSQLAPASTKIHTSTLSGKPPKPTGKTCKPKSAHKRSIADETRELYDRALAGAHARRERVKRTSF